MEYEESLKPWSELTKEVLEDVQSDIWTAQAICKAAYRTLEDKAVAGLTPDLEEQAEVMLLLKAAGEYAVRADRTLNQYI